MVRLGAHQVASGHESTCLDAVSPGWPHVHVDYWIVWSAARSVPQGRSDGITPWLQQGAPGRCREDDAVARCEISSFHPEASDHESRQRPGVTRRFRWPRKGQPLVELTPHTTEHHTFRNTAAVYQNRGGTQRIADDRSCRLEVDAANEAGSRNIFREEPWPARGGTTRAVEQRRRQDGQQDASMLHGISPARGTCSVNPPLMSQAERSYSDTETTRISGSSGGASSAAWQKR